MPSKNPLLRKRNGIPLVARKPAYFVVYDPTGPIPRIDSPIVDASAADFGQSGTLPHLLDRDFIPALRALWFCLHLPATCYDFLKGTSQSVKQMQGFDFGHEIILMPADLLEELAKRFANPLLTPAVLLVEEKHLDSCRQLVARLGWSAEIVGFTELMPNRLTELWLKVAQIMEVKSEVQIASPPSFCDRLDVGALLLPLRRLRSQMSVPNELTIPQHSAHLDQLVNHGLHAHVVLATVALLEAEGCTQAQAEERFPDEYERQALRLRLPVSVALPGLPSSYCKAVYQRRSANEFFKGWQAFDPTDTFENLRGDVSDRAAERAAIEIAVAHSACAATGLGMVLDPVPPELFARVALLEKAYRESVKEKKPARVWKLIQTIGTEMGKNLTPSQSDQLSHASQLTAYTNFPIGWTILPGSTSPLMCQVPIAYRPLLPLTRTLQQELHHPPVVDIGESVRILLIETLSADDPIHRASISALKLIEADLHNAPKIDIAVRAVGSVLELRQAIESQQPDILLLSSHGRFDASRGIAGITVGNEICLGPELGPMPPVVLLSACHVAPRGTASVNVAELLIREGALAVLGTQIPVNVDHNALLMTRFFVYISESISMREPHRTLAEVWHRTAAGNAINDIVNSDKDVRAWAHTPVNGITPIAEFMRVRSPGRLHLAHIYRDSEELLMEIAGQHGIGDKLKRLINRKTYLPETLFYSFFGWPERIRLNDPVVRKHGRQSSFHASSPP